MFGSVVAAPISVYPVRAEGFTQLLNGDWSFKYIAGLNAGADAGFSAASFAADGTADLFVDVTVSQPGDGNKTLLSHNAVISGLGNKGTPSETLLEAAKTQHIAGSLTLVPLDAAWPAALTRWFGKPAAAPEVFRPFYHS